MVARSTVPGAVAGTGTTCVSASVDTQSTSPTKGRIVTEQHSRRSRGNGEGSIYQRADGKWCAALQAAGGKRRVVYGKTRAEVAKKLRAAQENVDKFLPAVLPKQTIKAYLARWLETTVRPSVRY